MRTLTTYFILLVLVSCKNNKKSFYKEFYYPNKAVFLKKNNFQLIDIKKFETLDELVSHIESLKCLQKKAYLKIKNNNIRHNILISTSFANHGPPLLKFKNIISISKDSILKEKKHPISSLKIKLSKDLLNFGKDNKYSDSPEKLVVSITTEINEINNLILKTVNTFNQIQKESPDSLILNIFLNRRMEIYPLPPRTSNIE